ncbi:hypothetical protein AMS68_000479 [Peltaster fructicola]|uniref:Uncharacterized protein n=1 Tax=Peltaster fructicola TaxID=286661 RepID=A0A6H0XJS1_9PEZI|nr:hypothetical protein AMS68_000479 [Peltaster fructicola]
MANLVSQRPQEECLPAVFRDNHVFRLPSHEFDEFLRQDLSVKRIDDLERWLWIVGRPYQPRPLSTQVVLRRSIIATEEISLHLVWSAGKIFVKPLPAYLTTDAFYSDYLAPTQAKRASLNSVPPAQQSFDPLSLPRQVERGHVRGSSQSRREDVPLHDLSRSGERGSQHGSPSTRVSDEPRDMSSADAPLRPALGLLYSYLALVQTELDFALARQAHLLPHGYTWDEWKILAARAMSDWPEKSVFNHIPHRYMYGELRLSRLDKLYRFVKGDLLVGYSPLTGYTRYGDFLADNLGMIGPAAVYFVMVLSAMQVGLATERLSQDASFQYASLFFSVFTIVAPLVAIFLIMLAFMFLFFFNWIMAYIRWTHRDRQIGLRKTN